MKAKRVEGHWGDTIFFCSCGEILGILSREKSLVIVRKKAGMRVEIPNPDRVSISCSCQLNWQMVNGDLEVQIA